MKKECGSCKSCKNVYFKRFFLMKESKGSYCENKKTIVYGNGNCGLWERRTKEMNIPLERIEKAEEDIKILLKLFRNL